MALTRQQLEQQLVAAHRSGNVQAAQQAAYAIRAYDQAPLSADVPSVNAPPPIERVPKPTFGSQFEDFSRGMGRGIVSQLEGIKQTVTQPVETAKALYGAAEAAVRNPSQAIGELWNYGKRTVQQATSGPEGFGQVLGENMRLTPSWKRTPTQAELDVYHGTPHKFEPEEGAPLGRFRSQKIGTGEGAQAYGYGLYLAESPDVAEGYRIQLAYDPDKMKVGGVQINALYDQISRNAARLPPQKYALETEKLDILERLMMHDRMDSVEVASKDMSPETQKWFQEKVKPSYETFGSLYKVDLPDAKIEQMLDWDKPISQQPKSLLNVAQSVANDVPNGIVAEILREDGIKGFASGGDLYRSIAQDLGSDSFASQALLTKGQIPGIKYLDSGSRGAGKGTRNFVVFPGEEQNLTVLERNGERAQVAPKAVAPAKPRVATWFSGGGTVESALPNHERVMAAEYNPQINEQANKTFGTSFPARDVNKIDPQELKAAKPDLFHASPVCKNFSAAKTMRGATELDRESANSVANAIRVATPPVVTVENVPQYADTALFKHITDALDDKGYKWDVVIHDAADYGAPQSRKRMLLRAVREGELPPLPPKTGGKDWYAAVSDLLPNAPDAVIPPVERRRLDDMIAAGKLDPSKPIITMGGSGFKGTWSAANAGGVAPTLKAANEKPRVIMPDGTVKTVTGRMMARLMGLGDDVPVPENQTLAKTVLGNGVSGDVTKALIAPLLNRTK